MSQSVSVSSIETSIELIQDHDRNLRAFLDRCEQRNLHLNVDKIQLRVTEVPIIGHTATANFRTETWSWEDRGNFENACPS